MLLPGVEEYAIEGAQKMTEPKIDWLKTVGNIAGAASKIAQPQQPAYQTMVPPQSMTIKPPAQAQPQTQRKQIPVPQADAMMQAAARRRMAEEPDKSETGSAIGTVIGGIAGAFAGNPAAGMAIGGAGGSLIDKAFE
jgi:uncharacterized protein YcfJ